ncbi:hypothetical protein O3597_06575 [Verrucosispora sp. WMMA2044]|uniref:Uncharacterized protein n=1 Tax=Verrucosispora sioxanthis TaxID=2499994 RepID=A0A6M1L800_9ACTN|nr:MULTISPECIES: hypothetical protein [Micromonospora]NEE65260.1 hypothetical protein [Verrucosispora sioxanthis]NGM14370.1 hypothetical protein [Verrucosispora sioxanthis]WBB50124.1 hypothetical protein O3597_06575 [Verrucosispora sp. WMMA2044]
MCASRSTPLAVPRPARAASRHVGAVMSRYVAPLGFTLAAVWVAVLFFLASATH